MTTLEDQTAATLEAVARFNAAFDNYDVDGVMAAMTDDCVFENTGSPPKSSSPPATTASCAGATTGATATSAA